jgi:hypothetical protein
MRTDSIIPDKTYLAQIGNTPHGNTPRQNVFVRFKRREITATGYSRFHVKILDSITPLPIDSYVLPSNRILLEMSEAAWKEYKEEKINSTVEQIIAPPLSKFWTGATIRSFREYMK